MISQPDLDPRIERPTQSQVRHAIAALPAGSRHYYAAMAVGCSERWMRAGNTETADYYLRLAAEILGNKEEAPSCRASA